MINLNVAAWMAGASMLVANHSADVLAVSMRTGKLAWPAAVWPRLHGQPWHGLDCAQQQPHDGKSNSMPAGCAHTKACILESRARACTRTGAWHVPQRHRHSAVCSMRGTGKPQGGCVHVSRSTRGPRLSVGESPGWLHASRDGSALGPRLNSGTCALVLFLDPHSCLRQRGRQRFPQRAAEEVSTRAPQGNAEGAGGYQKGHERSPQRALELTTGDMRDNRQGLHLNLTAPPPKCPACTEPAPARPKSAQATYAHALRWASDHSPLRALSSRAQDTC